MHANVCMYFDMRSWPDVGNAPSNVLCCNQQQVGRKILFDIPQNYILDDAVLLLLEFTTFK